jgi:hypothetical protein
MTTTDFLDQPDHCQFCGSTDRGVDGYSVCCNEPMISAGHCDTYCHHERVETVVETVVETIEAGVETAPRITSGGRVIRDPYDEVVRYDPGYGDTSDRYLATLTWRDNGTDDDTEYALIDNGTITRTYGDVSWLTIRLQDRRTGEVRAVTLKRRLIDAFMRLGLSATRCNGIDGWLTMTLMPGSAGRD